MKSIRSVIFAVLLSCFFTGLSGQERGASADQGPVKVDQVVASAELGKATTAADSTAERLDIPNVFSPNNDQTNDYFEVSTDGTTVYKFSVFTKGGSRIYYTESPTIFWDGNSINGREMSTGSYYYVIQDLDRQNKYSGIIYLFR